MSTYLIWFKGEKILVAPIKFEKFDVETMLALAKGTKDAGH